MDEAWDEMEFMAHEWRIREHATLGIDVPIETCREYVAELFEAFGRPIVADGRKFNMERRWNVDYPRRVDE